MMEFDQRRVQIVRGSLLTRAQCTCGNGVQNVREKVVLEWANRHDSAGGSPDNHIVSITQTAVVYTE